MTLLSSLRHAISRPADRIEAPGDGDTELVRRSQTGDLDAFNLLVERYQDHVYAVCYRLLGDRDTADDACQDAFLSAFRAIRGYRGGSFIAWLLRIAKNECFDQLRARRPQNSLGTPPEDVGLPARLVAEPLKWPEGHVLRGELAHALERELFALPADQRLVVMLRDIQGHSYEEIVAATGWPIGAIKSRLSRARMILRSAMHTTTAVH